MVVVFAHELAGCSPGFRARPDGIIFPETVINVCAGGPFVIVKIRLDDEPAVRRGIIGVNTGINAHFLCNFQHAIHGGAGILHIQPDDIRENAPACAVYEFIDHFAEVVWAEARLLHLDLGVPGAEVLAEPGVRILRMLFHADHLCALFRSAQHRLDA